MNQMNLNNPIKSPEAFKEDIQAIDFSNIRTTESEQAQPNEE